MTSVVSQPQPRSVGGAQVLSGEGSRMALNLRIASTQRQRVTGRPRDPAHADHPGHRRVKQERIPLKEALATLCRVPRVAAPPAKTRATRSTGSCPEARRAGYGAPPTPGPCGRVSEKWQRVRVVAEQSCAQRRLRPWGAGMPGEPVPPTAGGAAHASDSLSREGPDTPYARAVRMPILSTTVSVATYIHDDHTRSAEEY